MKKLKKKPAQPPKGKILSADNPAPSVSVNSPGILVEGRDGDITLRPLPEELLLEAEDEPNQRDLAEYFSVIVKLREKGFSFREIAEWLCKRDVDADHNAVYRVYTKHMTVDEAELEAELEQEERDAS